MSTASLARVFFEWKNIIITVIILLYSKLPKAEQNSSKHSCSYHLTQITAIQTKFPVGVKAYKNSKIFTTSIGSCAQATAEELCQVK